MSRPSASVTVEQLAQGLGHDPVAFRRRLTELGLDRWLTAEGRVPVAKVDDLVDRVKRGLPDHGASIEQLMQAQGVQTIRGEKQQPRPQRQNAVTAQQKQPTRPVDAPRPLPPAPMTIDLRADDLPPPPKQAYTRAQLLAGKAPKAPDPLPIGRGPSPSVSQQAYHITRDQLQHAQEELERRARLLTEADRAARARSSMGRPPSAKAAQHRAATLGRPVRSARPAAWRRRSPEGSSPRRSAHSACAAVARASSSSSSRAPASAITSPQNGRASWGGRPTAMLYAVQANAMRAWVA